MCVASTVLYSFSIGEALDNTEALDCIESHASEVLAKRSRLITIAGDHTVVSPAHNVSEITALAAAPSCTA